MNRQKLKQKKTSPPMKKNIFFSLDLFFHQGFCFVINAATFVWVIISIWVQKPQLPFCVKPIFFAICPINPMPKPWEALICFTDGWSQTHQNNLLFLSRWFHIKQQKGRHLPKYTDTTHLSTLHVVAALVFLYWGLAIGTGFGVRQQPQTIGCVLIGFTHTSHFNNRRERGKESK